MANLKSTNVETSLTVDSGTNLATAITGATVSDDTITFTRANGGTFAVTTSDADTVNTFDGAYSSLSGLPTLFDGAYSSLTGLPTLGTAAAAATGDFAAASHNHTSLTGITSLGFAAQSTDSASITTTISGTSTFFDFNLTDDNNNDW